MAGIAPVDASTGLSASLTVGAAATTTAPSSPLSATGTTAGTAFTAFPSSYQGFGTNGSTFGIVGVRNGTLAVFAPESTAPSDISPAAASSTAGATSQAASDPPPSDPPPGDPPADPSGLQVATDPPSPLEQQQIAYGNLVNVTFRLSAAYGEGNSAAVAQLKPSAVELYNGQLQGSIWAGLGTSPAQTFARPEIPYIFLNVAA